MEAPLRRAASQTIRSRVYPGFIPRDAFSSPHAHHVDEETARIAAVAYDAGFVIKSLDSFREDLGSAIATRMRTLSNKYMWQTASFTVRDFPREALLSLPEGLKTQDSPNLLQYNANSMAQVEVLAVPILRCTKSMRGLTRLLKKPSEPAARLIATLSALTLTWKQPQQQRSRPALVVDLQFVISTQDGGARDACERCDHGDVAAQDPRRHQVACGDGEQTCSQLLAPGGQLRDGATGGGWQRVAAEAWEEGRTGA